MPLQFFPQPDQEEQAVRESLKEFLDTHVRPTVREDDKGSHFRRDVFNAMAQKGFTAFTIGSEYGGGGKGFIPYFAAVEETARVSVALSVTVGVTNLIQGALANFGSNEQKKRFLPAMTRISAQ
ncbi:MAG: acyl-CoA dehydrogenase family protein [Chloroflexi bacterium]|nr:acyl-CoA dehydrogenase family protein [Chloroflexota bacterium]